MRKIQVPYFIIAGAPRSGTTWLYHLLDHHPSVYMARPVTPEPKFFLIDELYNKGLDYYSKTWFGNIPEGRISGEKSTNYLENPIAAGRIYRHIPKVKLIFILREPVERAWSNFLWSQMNSMEDQNFATALAMEEQREMELTEKLRYARPHAYFSRGLYAKLLAPYFDLFPREQILCVRYEDIPEKPEALADKLCRFLNLEPRPGIVRNLGVINPSKETGSPMPEVIRQKLRDAYKAPNRQLAELLGSEFQIWEGE